MKVLCTPFVRLCSADASAQPFARNPLVGAGLAAEVVHRELLRVSRALHVDDLGVVPAAGPILGLEIIAAAQPARPPEGSRWRQGHEVRAEEQPVWSSSTTLAKWEGEEWAGGGVGRGVRAQLNCRKEQKRRQRAPGVEGRDAARGGRVDGGVRHTRR